ncbi:hypothetical protein C7B65_03580 [Phormidesmis priestleyi ULC007]|uniref:Uncharacterized protein n=1 Tax=Phormidesmis priestleyi ULC007 TaxID=1920490 RepID=A0A2T1DMH9_9CYAN|nr:hypothetical protein [Phormidesmis priestleyi]PSB21671.1 hypothetical protein C7B65_03580 [Phormidesmis priestleyi ULC007]PZO50794.1 MAG: hypothetical protein DCF14_10390 [Phormidesmis priestleyi]
MASQKETKGKQDDSTLEEKQSTKAQSEEAKHVDADQDDASPDVDSLAEVLHGDLTEIESDAAIASVDVWVNFLKGHKEENLKELSASLKELKKLLKGKKSEASEIAEVLEQLGEQTTAIGDEAGRGVKGPLHSVGKALAQAAKKIEKAGVGSEAK